MTKSTLAVAEVTSTGSRLHLSAEHDVNRNFNGANVNASQCGMLINDTANFNGATSHVLEHRLRRAGAQRKRSDRSPRACRRRCCRSRIPCPEISGCAYLAANPPSTSNCTDFNGNGYIGALNSRLLQQPQPERRQRHDEPGRTSSTAARTSTARSITGSGVTIYVTASGTRAELQRRRDRDAVAADERQRSRRAVLSGAEQHAEPNFNGSTATYSGLIYAPGATSANFNGADGGYLVLVFGAANFNGSTRRTTLRRRPLVSRFIKQAVVAQ